MPKFARPTSYTGSQSNQNSTGSVRAANYTEAAAGSSTELYISPSTLSSAVGSLVPAATTAVSGIVKLTDNNTPVATKVYVDAIAIAGAPDWSTTVKGIGKLATNAEAAAKTATDKALVPSNIASIMAATGTIGGTTPAGASFTTIAASGAVDLNGGGTWDSGGTAISIGADADADAISIGTGAAARTITIGNVTTTTAIAINSGTGHITLTSTGTGDIKLVSADTVLIDSAGVLELNSSAGAISIGNDNVAQAINVGTAGARTITVGSNSGATAVNIEAGSGGLTIGAAASAQSITIGNVTGATAIAMYAGTGNFVLDGVAGTTYNIGAATTTGTVTIGGTSQTGNFTLAPSGGALTVAIANGNGAKTINIGSGINGNTISAGNGANSSAQIINVANGASAANSTVNILSGNGSAGTQTCNILGGTRAGALNLAKGAAAHVIGIGSASAGAVTVDTAAGISLDSATASNFTVTGAADLSLGTTLGSLNLTAGEADVAAIRIHASDAAGGIDCDAGTAGIAIDSTGAVSLDGAAASNFSVSGGGIDLSLISAAGRVVVNGEEAAADAVRILSVAGGLDVDVALQMNLVSSQNAADAIVINASAGGIDITAAGGAGEDIDITNSAGSVTITAAEAAGDAIVIDASNAAGGIDIKCGSGGLVLTGAGSFLSLATGGAGLRVKGGAATDFVGIATLVNGTVTVNNTNIAAGDRIFLAHAAIAGSTALGTLSYTISAGASFTINSVQAGTPASLQTNDDSDIAYFIVRPV
jgi:hypothetical protein